MLGHQERSFTQDSREHRSNVSNRNFIDFISMWPSFHIDGWQVTPTMKTCLGNQTDWRVVDKTARGTSDTVQAGSCMCFVQPEVTTWTASILFQNGLERCGKRDLVPPHSAISYWFPTVRVNPLTLQIRFTLSLYWFYWGSRWLTLLHHRIQPCDFSCQPYESG